MSIRRAEVISLLTQDDYYRKQRKWPIISYNDISKSNEKRGSFERFTIDNYNYRYIYYIPMEKIIENINIYFPFTNELLTKFQGHLVACGGSICKSITRENYGYMCEIDDVDFFFYDLDVGQANIMRVEIIEYMINTWKSYVGQIVNRSRGYEGGEVVIQDVKFYIQRNEYVTTLHVEELTSKSQNHRVYMYQFIHRIYPDISSIIGGFDLSASAFAYNGKEIFTTPLGAWSLINRYIIVDMGRRSTSYEYRLRKYLDYGFGLIFPGLTDEIVQEHLINKYNDRSFFKFKEKLFDFARDNGYYIDYHKELSNIFKKFNQKGEDIDEYDELAFHRLQKEKDILPLLVLDINNGNDDRIGIKQSKGNQYDWDHPNQRSKCDDEKYYLNKLSDYGNDEEYLAARSDYHHNHMYYKHVPSANATRLRLNNLAGVVSMLYIDNHNNIKEKLSNEVNNPNLGINDFTLDLYKERAKESISNFRQFKGHHWQQPGLIKYFGSFTSDILHDEDYNEYLDLMIENIKRNDEMCKKNLTGIKWITENPGRQWTSSINPIFKNPRDWYGKHYIPVLVGIPPEVETTLRLMKLERTQSIWTILPKDLFDLLLSYILRAYANEAWKYIK
jgi:hypothetical protein